jgi:5-hydroxyisourate hydrolase-like protein (transthyretin family)
MDPAYAAHVIDRFLQPCPSCNRHVADEAACPFCGAALPASASPPATLPGRFSRAAVFAGATLAGCWTGGDEPRTTPIEHHDHDASKQTDKHDKHDKREAEVTGEHRPSRIEGTLTDTVSGQPAASIEIHLVNTATRAERTAFTTSDGRYTFDNVEPGSYTLTWGTNNPRQNRSVMHTTVTEGARITLNLTIAFPRQNNNSNIPMPYGAPPARYRIV